MNDAFTCKLCQLTKHQHRMSQEEMDVCEQCYDIHLCENCGRFNIDLNDEDICLECSYKKPKEKMLDI